MMMRAPFDENLATLGSAGAFRVDLSADSIIGAVLEGRNTNIDDPQKELLYWYHRFGHGGFQKFQAMMEPCHPRSTSAKSGPSPDLKGIKPNTHPLSLSFLCKGKRKNRCILCFTDFAGL